jgi:hypothetical protein
VTEQSPQLPPFRVGASVYRRDRPMTHKGRLTATWWSTQTNSWQAAVVFPDGTKRLGTSRLMEVPRNG